MKNLNLLILIPFALLGCSETKKQDTKTNSRAKIFELVYNENLTPTQNFLINTNFDTLLNCQNGTKLLIEANSFADKNGTEFDGFIEMEVKEVFNKKDVILNNLTTKSNGKILESGGMIYINAICEDDTLQLIKSIKCLVDSPVDSEMFIYEGVRSDSSINWVNPVSTENESIQSFLKSTKHYYTLSEGNYSDSVSFYKERHNWLFSPNRVVGEDTTIQNVKITFTDLKYDTVKVLQSKNGILMQKFFPNKGVNEYREDLNTNYIFSIKKLGWANIDKLFKLPTSEKVNLIVKVNNNEFDYVFTSMMFKNRNIYLPGYEKNNSTYGFSHGDHEDLILPIGERVTILATAYKNDQPFVDIKTVIIKKNQTTELELMETTLEGLKEQLESKI